MAIQIDPKTGERIGDTIQIDPNTGERIGSARPAGLPAEVDLPSVAAHPAVNPQLSPSAPPPTAPHSVLGGVQNSFDENTRTSPSEPLLQTGLKSVVGAIGAPFVHPLNTAKGVLDMLPSSPDLPNVPLKANGKTYLRSEGNPIVDRGLQAYNDAKDGGIAYSATKLGGETLGGTLLGEAAGAIPGVARNMGANTSALRESIVGDPNAAALRGLRVGPASNKALRTVSAVEGSRPFLQGSTDLSDLQSRLPAAKNEVWSPYAEALDKIGNKKTPLGTLNELESRRMEVSAQLRALKSGDPQAVALAQQKGMSQAELLAEERQIKATLDPELRAAGVDPAAVRRTFSDLGTVERRVSGKSTLAEPSKQYGFGKITDIDIHKPGNILPTIAEGGRDILAGRPFWSAKPTDVAIREAFRTGGPKPSFRSTPFSPEIPEPRGYLEANTIGEPGGEDFTQGRIPSRPSIITPASPELRRLPATTSTGDIQPMIGVRSPIAPEVVPEFSRTRIRPTEFSEPSIISPRGYVVGPEGSVRGNPLFLEANEPRGLLGAPAKKLRKSN